MVIRLVGAALLVAGCGGFGFSLSAAHRREMALLKRLIKALQEMEWELKYRLTDLPALCRIGADAAGGGIRDAFRSLADRMDRYEVAEISGIMNDILSKAGFPRRVRRNMQLLGESLGRYDLDGQLQGLQNVRRECRKDLKELEDNAHQRLRSYQTLALCAGVALAILFL